MAADLSHYGLTSVLNDKEGLHFLSCYDDVVVDKCQTGGIQWQDKDHDTIGNCVVACLSTELQSSGSGHIITTKSETERCDVIVAWISECKGV